MTVLIARPPLQLLSMSAMQAGSRRLSARLQEKDGTQVKSGSQHLGLTTSGGEAKGRPLVPPGSKKRKNDYDEDDDGFTFTRVNKNKKPRQGGKTVEPEESAVARRTAVKTPVTKQKLSDVSEEPHKSAKDDVENTKGAKRKRKMSFSTPKARDPQPVRRSKRLSDDVAQPRGSPPSSSVPLAIQSTKKRKPQPQGGRVEKPSQPESGQISAPTQEQAQEVAGNSVSDHSATKISLPFADTPVIRRNKAMREGKSTKGDRRSSLGLRGRRASSLMETGNSNALPHEEVDALDFYKHIESDLMEPRRMKQLLTWCATRAVHAKPVGTNFEDASAKSAARVIEEELLKELLNKSELSNWFSREDTHTTPKPLPERPNPKNEQNLQKITELEEQINRLKLQRDSLQDLLQPPTVLTTDISKEPPIESTAIDRTLLSAGDAAILDSLQSTSQIPEDISRRIDSIRGRVRPTIDQFADGIHKLAQYRTATDNVAGRVLSICATKFAEREREGRRNALHVEEDRSPGRDLSSVLRGLSKAER